MSDQTWTAPAVERVDPPNVAGEREALEGWLDYHRATLLTKCVGLTADQLRSRSVPPGNLSLIGLVRHLAEVERWWFRVCVDGAKLDDIFCTPDNLDGDFDDVDTADVAADLATYGAEVELARQAATDHGLDDTFHGRKELLDVRWVFVHMIEEYARHNGHADLLRECIDGVTGE
jgi:Protein of unknown function (DUF664)